MGKLMSLLCSCFNFRSVILGIILLSSSVTSVTVRPKTDIIEFVERYNAYNNVTEESVKFLQKQQNSELIVGEDTQVGSRILLKCSAPYPVQWIYIGDGRPEFTTYTNVEWAKNREKPVRFTAEASLGLLGFQNALKETDTGNYTCRSTLEPDAAAFYYLFVPGSTLFASRGNMEVMYSSKENYVRIPCSVSNPKTEVTLYKSHNGKLIALNHPFDEARGFTLPVWNDQNAEGVYLCIGNYQRTFQLVQFTLVKSDDRSENDCSPSQRRMCGPQSQCNLQSGIPTCYCFRGHTGNPFNVCREDNGNTCASNQDCSIDRLCVDGKCTDPCKNYPCGTGTQCVVHKGKPMCICKPGYAGIAPFCKEKCESNHECSAKEICRKGFCDDPCPDSCGKNAICKVLSDSKRSTMCYCPPNYTGNARIECKPMRSQPDCPQGYFGVYPNCVPLSQTRCQLDSDCPSSQACASGSCKDPCKSWDCGAGSDFCQVVNHKAQCVCTSDNDCFDDEECTKGVCRLSPCNPVCGKNAICVPASVFSDKNPTTSVYKQDGYVCRCHPGFSGDPRQECYIGQRPPVQPPAEGCQYSCAENAECRIIGGQAACKCQPGYSGDGYFSCRQTSTPASLTCNRFTYSNDNPCGNHAECEVINKLGHGICKCKEGYTGIPPDCRIMYRPETKRRCDASEDCYDSEKCISGVCEDPCTLDTKCRGECRVVRHNMICSCPRGTVGDPWYYCRPAGVNPCDTAAGQRLCDNVTNECREVEGEASCICKSPYVGSAPNCRLECDEDSQCFRDKACKDNKCVNLCRIPGTCHEKAECRVVNHVPMCRCLPGYTGVPWRECTKIDNDNIALEVDPCSSGSKSALRCLFQ